MWRTMPAFSATRHRPWGTTGWCVATAEFRPLPRKSRCRRRWSSLEARPVALPAPVQADALSHVAKAVLQFLAAHKGKGSAAAGRQAGTPFQCVGNIRLDRKQPIWHGLPRIEHGRIVAGRNDHNSRVSRKRREFLAGDLAK